MTAKRRVELLGTGIYTLAEAARYTGYPHQTVRSWFKPANQKNRTPLFISDFRGSDSPRLISFLDLIDILVAGMLRSQGISMQ